MKCRLYTYMYITLIFHTWLHCYDVLLIKNESSNHYYLLLTDILWSQEIYRGTDIVSHSWFPDVEFASEE